MNHKKLPNKNYLNKILLYKEGKIYWKKTKKEAGYIRKDGYSTICINKSLYQTHRIIYAMFFCDPGFMIIDHINGIQNDNRIENLRSVSQKINCQNRHSCSSNNKEKILGVRFHNQSKKYQARITIDKKCISLGYFINSIDAKNAYIDAKRKYHKGCTI